MSSLKGEGAAQVRPVTARTWQALGAATVQHGLAELDAPPARGECQGDIMLSGTHQESSATYAPTHPCCSVDVRQWPLPSPV